MMRLLTALTECDKCCVACDKIIKIAREGDIRMQVSILQAKGFDIRTYENALNNSFISLTDIAKYKSDEPNDVIRNWMRRIETIEFLGLWECLNNENFNPVEFEGFKRESGRNSFTMSPQKWIRKTGAIGMTTKAGRYNSGTYAHSDIAFEFASWISPEFKLYIIKDYQRLKTEEQQKVSMSWNLQREIAKINYRIHTDAIKNNMIVPDLTSEQASHIYANEADLLNVALFGMTAREWRQDNPEKEGNIRDAATIQQLLVLSNMESYNALMIEQGKTQRERLQELRGLVIQQMSSIKLPQ